MSQALQTKPKKLKKGLKIITYSTLVIVLLCVSSAFKIPPQSTSVTIKITDIKNTKGYVEIGLYNKSANFPKAGKTYKLIRLKPTGSTIEHKFTGLSPGNYAVGCYHDENSDNKCNRNWMGMPIEAYGFSRNFRPKFSAPEFSDCSFYVKRDRLITIKMVY